MCGIAGLIVRRKENPIDIVSSMLLLMRHRGPDDDGAFVEFVEGVGWLGLGNNRLSILDLSPCGHQPMQSPDGRYVLIYNGEVYNYREIAKELGNDPILDISSGDTAVVLAALIKWEAEAFKKFNGMWALALYDRVRGTLLLSRDRMGVKPLYVYRDEQQFIFASEIKAILCACRQRLKVNREVAARYLLQGLLDAQAETFFERVLHFPPASFAVIDLRETFAGSPTYQTFWCHPFERALGDLEGSPPAEELRETFIDAVRVCLRSDVPVGVLLSGGIDSSSILGAIGSMGMLDNISVLSVVSDDPESNEESFIDIMANYTGCQVLKFEAHRDPLKLLDELPEACWFNDQPFGGFSSLAHRNLMRMARDRKIKVLLTGQGSDEQLGGYNKFLYFYLQDRVRSGEYRNAARVLMDFVRQRTVIPEFSCREAKRYLPSFLRCLGNRYLGGCFEDVNPMDTTLGGNYQEREWRDIRYLSLPALLHSEDRMSMSCSVEMRVPFVDYRIVELLGRTPPSDKLSAGWTKAIFREAMEGIIPKQIQYRKDKKGFNVPEEKWLRQPLQSRLSRAFEEPMLAEVSGYIRRPALQRMYKGFLGGSRLVSAGDIFRVYCFEVFLRCFEAFISG